MCQAKGEFDTKDASLVFYQIKVQKFYKLFQLFENIANYLFVQLTIGWKLSKLLTILATE